MGSDVGVTLGELMKPRLAPLESVLPYLRRMEASGRFANGGPLARELESRLARRLGVDPAQVVAVVSATAGLTGALSVSPQRVWAVPAFTFAATAHAVVASGGEMEIHDVDPLNWQLVTGDLCRGLVPVLPFGCGLDLGAWPADAEVVVDAAASLGAAQRDLGSLPASWTVVFSLHATKVMPCGEGGLAVFGDPARAAELRSWAHFRLDEGRSAIGPGANALMPETSAAFGLAALDGWDQELSEWRAARAMSEEVMRELDLAGPPDAGADAHPYWLIRLPTVDARVRAESALAAQGIASRRWWGPGLHRMPAFDGRVQPDCPVTDDLAQTTLGLPFWRGMTALEVGRVRAALASALIDVRSQE